MNNSPGLQPFYVPKEPYDVIPLMKTIAIATEKGLVIVDPTKYDLVDRPLCRFDR
jgi:hypothetical protein